MRRIISALIFSLILILPLGAYAHPVDTSTLLIYLKQNVSAQAIEPNKFEGILTFNWLQLSAMTGENRSPVDIYQDIAKYEETFSQFANENIKISSQNNSCTQKLHRYSEDSIDLVLNFGVRYEVSGVCEKPIENIKISNTVFEDQITTQSNIIQLFIDGKLTQENDKGEVEYSGENNLLPTQTSGTIKEKLSAYFNNLIKSENGWAIPIIFFTIYLMGALHSLEGGHNKVILGSLVVDKKVDFKQSIVFTVIFTITHMSDIILLSIGLLFLDRYIDLYRILPNITVYTIIALIFISLYSLTKEIKHMLSHKLGHEHHHHDEHDHEHTHAIKGKSLGNAFLMAFISGLAPCLTGWSIFMLLFSTGRVNLILPGMLFFGLGVFTILFIYTLILHKSRDVIINKIGWIGEYSTIISLSLVLISAIIQLISVI